ncbi:LOW QUALITY PROTEIN: protein OPI10 homolog [Homalodisca vitripennis]|uniref:LOW QUALITY PROTEIN: protein OPI10 homolog n=1 Tax=Homalodisca vitripennis TaxID=197043 RepID=UPI001EEA5B7F|nr:LOW QUALITY PROTEIN: protein OPI10 homolog [Homalodisca vitripennis]
MFGIIVSGRMVQTNFQQIAERQFVSVVSDADNVNHIVIFMTGQILFPDGFAGLIYFSWPDPDAPPNWQLLGYISNDKPSAVFKISGLKKKTDSQVGFLQFIQRAISHDAQIGISVESVDVVQQQITMLEASKTNTQTQFMEFSQKMLQNFMNYATSFITTQAQMVPNPAESYIPVSAVHNWYQNFERRLAMNPYFWQS